jgi:hypothetical protein
MAERTGQAIRNPARASLIPWWKAAPLLADLRVKLRNTIWEDNEIHELQDESDHVSMSPGETLRQRAFHNSIGALRLDRTFPLNVFRENWHDFHFFESDSLFEPTFIAVMNALLDNEGSQICCLINLGATVQKDYSNPPARYLDRPTDSAQYMSMLRGNGSPDAWLYLVDRYVIGCRGMVYLL